MFISRGTILDYCQCLFNLIRNNLPESIWNLWNLLAAGLACLTRLFPGAIAARGLEKCKKPKESLILYQYEACPFCMQVREMLGVLQLPYLTYPCPRETVKSRGYILNSRFRQQLVQEAGKSQFPYLYDPNTKMGMYETDAIKQYLHSKYGSAAALPLPFRISQHQWVLTISTYLRFALRPLMDMGVLRTPATHRSLAKPLEVYTFEGNPWGKVVREELDSCEITYVMHPTSLFGSTPATAGKTCWCCWGLLIVDPNDNNKEYTCAMEFLRKVSGWRTGGAQEETWSQYGIEDVPQSKKEK